MKKHLEMFAPVNAGLPSSSFNVGVWARVRVGFAGFGCSTGVRDGF
jgi:hypothetical protein